MYKKLLTKQEERVMELYWAAEFPLTSKDVLQRLSGAEWTGSYVYSVLRALIEKGLITECGQIRGKAQYMREFRVCFTKEEYFVRLAYANRIDAESFIRFAAMEAVQESSPEKVQRWLAESRTYLKNKTKIR